jgi:flagellar biosynthesis GTPase FlhF
LVDQAQPFAEVLREMEGSGEVEVPVGPPRAKVLREGLVAAGVGDDIAREVVEAVVVSQMPFASSGRLRTLVRNELALRTPVAPAAGPGARTVVVVGPAGSGKTTALEAIAVAHEAAGKTVTRCEIGDSPAPHPGGLLLIDTPALWGGAEELARVAAAIGGLDAPEVHLVMRAGTAAGAGAELVEGLGALGPNRLLVTGAAETSHLGGVVDVAIRSSLPLSYVAESPERIAPADPRDLAARITP